jgi:hypothetical protein
VDLDGCIINNWDELAFILTHPDKAAAVWCARQVECQLESKGKNATEFNINFP